MQYRKQEAVAPLQDVLEKINPSPHHSQVIFGHEKLLPGKINTFGLQHVAESMQFRAPIVRNLVQCNDYQMVKKMLNILPRAKALQEHVYHCVRLCPCLVQRRQNYCPIWHGSSLQNILQAWKLDISLETKQPH